MKNQLRDFSLCAKLSTMGRLDCKIFGSMLQHCVMTKSNKFSHSAHPLACSPNKLVFFKIFFYVFHLKSTWGFIYHKISFFLLPFFGISEPASFTQSKAMVHYLTQ